MKIKQTNSADDNLYEYEYFHPVDVLGYWTYELIDLVNTDRFWNPPRNGKKLTPSEDEKRYGPIRTTRDWKPWVERYAIACSACQHAADAVIGVNRWLRYGLGDRAGSLETEFRALFPQIEAILAASSSPSSIRKNRESAEPHLNKLLSLYRELKTVAINRDDGTFEEWFRFVEMMRASLFEFRTCHDLLMQIVFRKPRGRVGDLLYRYLVSMSDFEQLLHALENQLRRGSDKEFNCANEMILLSVRARQEFEEVLTNRKRSKDPYPTSVHESLRHESALILRRLEKTLAERSSADLARTVWITESPSTVELPIWDSEKRELRFQNKLCKRFRTRAVNQELVLQSFQETTWQPRIDDPLPAGKRYETIRQLNKGNKVLKFRADGQGDGICWELRQPPK